AVLAVRGTDTGEPVPLHHTGVALALAVRRDVDLVAGGEDVGANLLADLVVLDRGRTNLGERTPRRDAGLLEVARLRLTHLATGDLAEADLDRGVAVDLRLADLGHHIGVRFDDGDGYDA